LGQTASVLGHIGINVPDLEIARRYYSDLMPRVGFETFLDDSNQFAYRPAAGKRGTHIFFYPTRLAETYHRDTTTGLQHLAFMVRSRTVVDDLHKWAERTGNEVLHRPREFPEYPPPYYATFWLDPFGIMLETVCHHAS
jgi:catechol 2,3-dioxygenase-like lactoylglutathione lyase family enzyme